MVEATLSCCTHAYLSGTFYYYTKNKVEPKWLHHGDILENTARVADHEMAVCLHFFSQCSRIVWNIQQVRFQVTKHALFSKGNAWIRGQTCPKMAPLGKKISHWVIQPTWFCSVRECIKYKQVYIQIDMFLRIFSFYPMMEQSRFTNVQGFWDAIKALSLVWDESILKMIAAEEGLTPGKLIFIITISIGIIFAFICNILVISVAIKNR